MKYKEGKLFPPPCLRPFDGTPLHWIRSAAPFKPSTFSPLGLSSSRHMGLPHIFKFHAYFHNKSLFLLLSLPGRLYPRISKWLTFSPWGLSWNSNFLEKLGVPPTRSYITSPKLHLILCLFLVQPNTLSYSYILQNTYYYLEFIYFLLSLEYNYHEGRSYTWLMHHGTSRT